MILSWIMYYYGNYKIVIFLSLPFDSHWLVGILLKEEIYFSPFPFFFLSPCSLQGAEDQAASSYSWDSPPRCRAEWRGRRRGSWKLPASNSPLGQGRPALLPACKHRGFPTLKGGCGGSSNWFLWSGAGLTQKSVQYRGVRSLSLIPGSTACWLCDFKQIL